MKEIILYADATFDLKVRVGDKIEQGDEMGISADSGDALFSPVKGTIEKISFSSVDHTFVIRIIEE